MSGGTARSRPGPAARLGGLGGLAAGCILCVSLTISAAAALGGCGERPACAVLFDAVEAPLAEVRSALPNGDGSTSPPPTPEVLRATAAAYSKLAAALEPLALSDPELQDRATSYRKHVTAIASGFELLAAAVEEEDGEKLKEAREALDLASNNEQLAWGGIDRICGSH